MHIALCSLEAMHSELYFTLFLSRWKILAQEVCFHCGYTSFVSYVLVTTLSWLLAVIYLPESTLAITVILILTVLVGALYLLFTKRALHPVYIIVCNFQCCGGGTLY